MKGMHVQWCKIFKRIAHSTDMFRIVEGILIINVASRSWHIRDSKESTGKLCTPKSIGNVARSRNRTAKDM